MLGYPNNYFFTPIFDFVDLVPYSTTQFFFKALRRKKNFIIVYLFIYLFIAFFLGHQCLCLWRPSLYMFMAAFVLSVYVYLRRKEGCLAQASFVGVLRAKPDKKAINRKEEYEGKEERSIPFQSFPSLRVCLRPSSFYL